MYWYSTLNFFVAMVAITQAVPQQMLFKDEFHASQLRRILGVEDLKDAPEYEIVYPQVLTSEGNYGINTEAISKDSLNIDVEAFGETLHLAVQQDSSLFSPDFYAEEISDKGEPPLPVTVRLECLYTGKVTSEPDSMVSLSTASGLTAIIYHANGPTFIEPLDVDHITDRGRPHIAFKKDERRVFRCGTAGSRQGMKFPFDSSDAVLVNGKKTMELAVFTDVAAYTQRGNTITSGVATLLGAVRIFFKEPSLGTVLEIKLVSLHIYKTTDPGFSSDLEASYYVAANDQYNRNIKSDSDPNHWDNALYLTGHESPQYFLGLALLNECNSWGSVSLVTWGGAETAEVIAHELGHNLNMDHDSEGNSCSGSGFVMAAYGLGFTKWSTCSKAYFASTIGSKTCYND